jgi:hypothetical protein
MLSAENFFAVCAGQWQADRIYHYPLRREIERSHTKFNAENLTSGEKHQISSSFIPREFFKSDAAIEHSYGFAIAFATKSETGEEVSMCLKALFIPDTPIAYPEKLPKDPIAPSEITLVGFGLERREE